MLLVLFFLHIPLSTQIPFYVNSGNSVELFTREDHGKLHNPSLNGDAIHLLSHTDARPPHSGFKNPV